MYVILELLPPDDLCWQTQSSRKRSVPFSFNRLAGISCIMVLFSQLFGMEKVVMVLLLGLQQMDGSAIGMGRCFSPAYLQLRILHANALSRPQFHHIG